MAGTLGRSQRRSATGVRRKNLSSNTLIVQPVMYLQCLLNLDCLGVLSLNCMNRNKIWHAVFFFLWISVKLSMCIRSVARPMNTVGAAASSACTYTYIRLYTGCHQKECARPRENVPNVKVHRYNPKHLYPKLNGYGDNGQRKKWSSCGSTYCTC